MKIALTLPMAAPLHGGGYPPWDPGSSFFNIFVEISGPKTIEKRPSQLPEALWTCPPCLYLRACKFSGLEMAWTIISQPFFGFHGGLYPPWNLDFLDVFHGGGNVRPQDYQICTKPVKFERSNRVSSVLKIFFVEHFSQIL